MFSAKLPMYGSVSNSSTVSTEKWIDDLAASAPKTAALDAFSPTVQKLQVHQVMAQQGQKIAAMVSRTVASAAALAPPWRGESGLSRAETTHNISKSETAFETRKSIGHINRSFAEVPLTSEGVTVLQNDVRVSRADGTIIGCAAGLLGIPLGAMTCGPYHPEYALGRALLGGSACILLGTILGYKIGLFKDASPEKIRLHGLFYTGIVDNKGLSAYITGLILDRNADNDRPAGEVAGLLNRAIEDGKLSLTPEQIAGVETYYALARSARRVENV